MSTTRTPLPRGRHDLSRTEVARIQRDRILDGLAEAMAERGFVSTSVADVIRCAGVSRETFYQLFESKADAFDAALDIAGDLLGEHLLAVIAAAPDAGPVGDGPSDDGSDDLHHDSGLRRRVSTLVGAYLEAILLHRSHARLHLVEVWAAGPDAIARRAHRQRDLAHRLAAALGRDDPDGRFAAELVIAGLSTLVTAPLLDGDDDGLLALRGPATDLTLQLLG